MTTLKTLTPEELETLLAESPLWALEHGMLTRTWVLPTFPEAVAFVHQVAALAEQANHHPDIDIRYNRVRLALISHDANSLTPRDARMVRKLNAAFPVGHSPDA